MIFITHPITISATNETFIKYSFIMSSGCIGVDKTSDTVESSTLDLSPTFSFENTDCFDSSITLRVETASGCVQDTTFKVPSPCGEIGLQVTNNVEGNNPFVFVASVSGANQPYQVDWNFNEALFSVIQESAILKLSLKDGVTPPPQTLIKAKVIDTLGCPVESTFNYQFTTPTAFSEATEMTCIPQTTVDGRSVKAQVVLTLNASTPTGTTLDYDTIEVVSTDTNLIIEKLGENTFQLFATTLATAGEKSLTWSIKNNLGITSNVADITLQLPSCGTRPSRIYFLGETRKLTTAEAQVGQVILVDLADNIVSGTPDWDEFTFKQGTGQTLNSATSLTTQNANVILTNSRKLQYTITSLTLPSDPIMVTIKDEFGVSSNTATITIDLETIAVPAISNQTIPVGTGSSTVVNLITGATGSPDPTSVVITEGPTDGNYSLGTDASLIYTPSQLAASTDTIKYKVANYEGELSDEITVTFNILHAGLTATVSICDEDTVNLVTQLGANITSGGTWTAVAGNPSAPSLADPTAVDFTGAGDGNYGFTYTVTSGSVTDTATIFVTKSEYSVSAIFTQVTAGVGANDYVFTTRFQSNPTGTAISDLKVYVHKGPTGFTPSSANIIDKKTPTSYDPDTGIFDLEYEINYNESDVLVMRGEVTTLCGEKITANGDEVLGS